jgi:hypothetical protein
MNEEGATIEQSSRFVVIFFFVCLMALSVADCMVLNGRVISRQDAEGHSHVLI